MPRAPSGLFREIVREACFGLYHHRFRAALSMLGISWGIVSVVVLLAYGEGFEERSTRVSEAHFQTVRSSRGQGRPVSRPAASAPENVFASPRRMSSRLASSRS